MGDIDLKQFDGQITVIQGAFDRFGNIERVKEDLKDAISRNITYIDIPNSDHSYRDVETQEPIYQDKAISKIN